MYACFLQKRDVWSRRRLDGRVLISKTEFVKRDLYEIRS